MVSIYDQVNVKPILFLVSFLSSGKKPVQDLCNSFQEEKNTNTDSQRRDTVDTHRTCPTKTSPNLLWTLRQEELTVSFSKQFSYLLIYNFKNTSLTPQWGQVTRLHVTHLVFRKLRSGSKRGKLWYNVKHKTPGCMLLLLLIWLEIQELSNGGHFTCQQPAQPSILQIMQA